MTLTIQENIDLQPLNTLALSASARYFCKIESEEDIPHALDWAQKKSLPLLVLGGDSTIVLAGDWPGLVLAIALQSKQIERTENGARVTVAAGENWHELVQWTLRQNLYGLENLTLIPGTAGAAPIQNIGAYGVELADRLESVRGWSLQEDRMLTLSAAECELGYRDSIFKNALRDRFIVTGITLRLDTEFTPVLNYPALRDELRGYTRPTAAQVEQTVRSIRQSKLPDPAQLPNAGSFFKNPVVSRAVFERLRQQYPQLPSYPAPAGVKIPAAWLVDQCGWKGRRRGAVGVHDQQALVLVHYAERNADRNAAESSGARELLALAEAIRGDVLSRFEVALELEPAVYRGSPV